MKDEINSYKNQENTSKNKLKKYITVKRIKSKNKKISVFSEKDKENININNNIYFANNKTINDITTHKKRKSTNTYISLNKTIKNNNNISSKKLTISIFPNELDYIKESRNIKDKKSKFPYTIENKTNKEKESHTIQHMNSYLSPRIKSRPKIKENIYTSNNNLKNRLKIKKNKISNTFSINELHKNNDKIYNNNNNKTRITKDTIFVKEITNLNLNLYNTISSNLNKDYYNRKCIYNKNTINNRNKIIEKNNNTKANTIESLNTIIIKRNNSALLTFGNTNNDSLSESFSNSKGNNLEQNYLLILKQENESLKNELMKTKEKVDILENKIDNLICEKNTNNNPCLKEAPYTQKDGCKDKYKYREEEYKKIKNNTKIKNNDISRKNNKICLKSSQSQKNFKCSNHKSQKAISNKTKLMGRTLSRGFTKRKK